MRNLSGYVIMGQPISIASRCRDLGIMVDSKLRFHVHIDGIVGKVGAMMSNLLRSTICRSKEFMVKLWVSHIRPLMEYGSCVWNVGYLGDVRRLESLQRRWTREVQGMVGLEYVTRLRRLGLFSIKGRLLRIDLVKIWKAFHADVDVGLRELFEMARSRDTRGHRLKMAFPICRSEMGRRTFAVRCINIWNALPASIVEQSNAESYKRQLDMFLEDRLFTPG